MRIVGCALHKNGWATRPTPARTDGSGFGLARIGTIALLLFIVISPTWAEESNGEAALRERATAYWEAQLHNDWPTIWSLLAPKDRWQVPPKDTKRESPLRYLSYRIEKVTVDGEEGRVTVETEIQLLAVESRKGGVVKHVLEEPWVRVDGAWYRRYQTKGR
ncbi:MAG: hypothetical protein KGL31_04865 [candidate division NC10 bacterium]|nr:hypothetical protein [candidate division NC10 bacterium]MDE2321234.1 hypothetical protein [candidate division NC10 bacterium]